MPLLRKTAILALGIGLLACSRTEDGASGSPEHTRLQNEGKPAAAAPIEAIPLSVKATGQLGPGRGTLIVDIKAPEGAELTEGAPFRVSAKGADLTFPHEIDTKLDLKELPARLPLDVADGAQGPVELDMTYYYCTQGDDGSCRPERVKLSVEIDMTGGGEGGEAHLIHRPTA